LRDDGGSVVSQAAPVRVFIGSGEASLVERKTLIYSLRKHTRRPLDIYVFNGTHNAIEHNDAEPVAAPLSLKVKYQNRTEFSNYRFLIPELCGGEGRAIWLDSDMICLADIGELFDTAMDGCDFLAAPETNAGPGSWALSVMLIDCSRCRFDIEMVFREIDQGLYSYTDFHQMRSRFLARHPYRIGGLSRSWNMLDRHDDQTKIIHYTGLYTQPWKYRDHPYGELWFRYFNEARMVGDVSDWDIELSKFRSAVRLDLLEGNSPSNHSRAVGRTLANIRTRLRAGLVRRRGLAAR
jgi:hypothetical protein